MKKILLIVEREFLTRVRKKSFIIMTVLGPVFLAFLMLAPMLIMSIKDTDEKKILVADQTGIFANKLENGKTTSFQKVEPNTVDSLKKNFKQLNCYAILSISGQEGQTPASITLYSHDQLNMDVQQNVERQMESIMEREKMKAYHIENIDTIMANIKTNFNVSTVRLGDDGSEKQSHSGVLMGAAYIASFVIYMFIFLFGSMVMRGVIEEKSSRIVEVIISSVKPFQLMIGKIVGVASVGLLQFVIWIAFTFGIVTIATGVLADKDSVQTLTEQAEGMSGGAAAQLPVSIDSEFSLGTVLSSIPFVSVLVSFLFYFLFGYLLYASLFAAIGSAVESDADAQQLVLPVTIPLIIGLFIMMHTFQYPNSALSFWGSMIPFTSPMVMMARVPFGVPIWQLVLSLGLLFGTFMLTTWFASKIYRVGILMYGKKPSLKEMIKWITYKS